MKKQAIDAFYQVNPKYIEQLHFLQVELLKLQKHVSDEKLRLAILFEGRDAAGKGSAIARFTQFLNPSSYRVVALGKPTKKEKGQWYFQRYIKRLPDAGQMVFFDRSWYNRAVVEPVMGFCTPEQYDLFIKQVNPFEEMLTEDGISLVKFWFSINMDDQKARIQQRLDTPLIRWKVSPVDLAAQDKWHDFTTYKEKMLLQTSTAHCPWRIVKGSSREDSRIQAMRFILSLVDYKDKDPDLKPADPGKVFKHPSK